MDFETNSNQSDDLKSSISSLSTISLYQNEFIQLRHLVEPDRYSTPTHDDSGCDLQYDSLNVKYRLKIDTLLKHNKQLKRDLTKANDQIERLLLNSCQNSTIDLEKKCHNLMLKNSILEAELTEATNEKNELETSNLQLRIELNEIKSNFDNRSICIAELKDKISSQYAEIQQLTRDNYSRLNLLEKAKLEEENLKKCVDWYKNQLSQVQESYKNLNAEFIENKLKFHSCQEENEMLKLEMKTLNNKFDVFKLDSLKEKDSLLEEIKQLTVNDNPKTNVENLVINNNEALINLYKSDIEDLQNKLKSINEVNERQNENFKQSTRLNSELTSRCVTLQKTLQQKEYFLEGLETEKARLMREVDLLKTENFKTFNELQILKNNIANLEVKIAHKNKENLSIENCVQRIREQFAALKCQYDKLKEDLVEKNKQMLHLRAEQQELFMNNNWQVCELEKTKEKDQKISILKDNLANSSTIINRLENENNDLIKEIKRYENVVEQYRKTVETLEKTKRDTEEKNVVNRSQEKNKKLVDKLKLLTERIKKLQTQTELLRSSVVNRAENEKHLRIMLEVKELELHEKQKKYERNCRTLLEKIKEYMRRKNLAEKQCERLRQIHEKSLMELAGFKSKLDDVEKENDGYKNALRRYVSVNDDLKEKLLKIEEYKIRSKNDMENLRGCLNSEIENLRNSIDNKTVKILDLEQKESDNTRQIHDLKSRIKELQLETKKNNTERYFLQRLCNDLKLSLKSHVNHNKVLKEQLNRLSSIKDVFNSLPKISVLDHYDEEHLNELMQQNKFRTPHVAMGDVQSSLNGLKRDVLVLQQEILKKNFC